MPNLLKVLPKLQNCSLADEGYNQKDIFYFTSWARYALKRYISEDAIPFMSVDEANKVLDIMEASYTRPALLAWAARLREAVNS